MSLRARLSAALLLVALLPAAGAGGGRAAAAVSQVSAAVELDARSEDWSALRRRALLSGRFLPPYRPLSEDEIAEFLALEADQRSEGVGPAGLWRHDGCPCADQPLHLLLGGRLLLHELGPGDQVEREAGLRGQGLVLAVEPDLQLACGRLWAAVTARLAGPLSSRRRQVPDAVAYPGWPLSTGRPAAGTARRTRADWRLDLPRAAAGVRFGRWAATAGLFPASVGPGLDGDGLTLTSHAESLPQVVVRRLAPLQWMGVLKRLAPQHALVRAGWVSAQTLRYRTEWGEEQHRTTPVFSQWLLTWNHTPWWRTTVTHAALAAPRRRGTLWADLLQINLPLLDATWSEMDYGPLTDRLFSLTMEWRFRRAPWPVLPRAAGRLWWEYGGEDYRAHADLPLVPQIAAPASLAGVELVDARWDLGLQYLQTRHPVVLWYSNSSFTRGYSHHDIGLGHPLGGAVAAWTAVLRVRPNSAGKDGGEFELRGRTARWQDGTHLPASARREDLSLSWRLLGGGRTAWSLTAGWARETVAGSAADWLTARAARHF